MFNIQTYRIGKEDLPDLKKDELEAIQPLLDALNNTLGSTVPAVNSIEPIDFRPVTFTTKSTVSDTFPIQFTTSVASPQSVMIGNVVSPRGTDLSVPIVAQGFVQLQNGNISIPVITGLQPNTKYTLTFTVFGV